MLQGFRIYEKEVFIGTVKSTSLLCAQTYAHVALHSDGVTKFVHKHKDAIHTLVLKESCEDYNTISNEQSLFKFLYNTPNCSHGILSSDISLGSKFYHLYASNNYPTISREKILDGSGNTISPDILTYGASYEMYLFKTDASLTLQHLTVSGFTDHSLNIVDSTGPYLEISGCNFINNTVGVNINVDNSNNATYIKNSLFQSLQASKFSNANSVAISDGAFGGGAIRHLGTNLYITDSSFIDNSCVSNGGAITLKNILTLSGNNYFINNSVTDTPPANFGGAICGSLDFPLYLNIYGITEFSGNNSTGSGGAILSYNDLTISGGTVKFIHNKSIGGGAIYVAKVFNIIDTSIIFNSNHSTGTLGGGAIVTHDLKITGGTSTFIDNSAEQLGGAIYTDTGSVTISGGTLDFSNNNASSGGAIYSRKDITLTGISSGTFTNNHAIGTGGTGGAMSTLDGIILDGSFSFVDNSCALNGGALYSDNSNIQLLQGPYEFNGNTATNIGGALSAGGSVDISSAKPVVFHKNISQAPGGAISASDINIQPKSNVTFSENYSYIDGGAILTTNYTSIDASVTFSDNSCASNLPGGAIYVSKDIKITGGTTLFSGNKAPDGSGGAIYVAGTVILDSSGITFSANEAKDGSNIWIPSVGFNPQTSFITEDVTGLSGGVYPPTLDTSRAMVITTASDLSNFMGDASPVGVIRNDISNITPFDISFSQSKTFYGSILNGRNPVLSPSGSSSNTLIHSNSGDLYLYNLDVSGFVYNNTPGGGVGMGPTAAPPVVVNSKDDVHIHSCNIHDNSGLYTIFSVGNIYGTGNSSFKTNTSSYSGVLYSSSSISLDGSFSFVDNTTASSGGAMNATLDISLLGGPYEFRDNKAENGGAIFNMGTVDISTGTNLVVFNHNRCAEPSGQHIYTKDICYNGSDVSFIDPSCTNGPDGSAVWTTSGEPSTRCPA